LVVKRPSRQHKRNTQSFRYIANYKYSAFVETGGTATVHTDYRYTGQREEEEIGLYFYKARFYDAALGRFVQADTVLPNPANAKSFDRFAYVNNNPINGTDPTGHCSISTSTFLSPFGNFGFYASCVQDVVDAYSAFHEGETNLGALYLEATGVKDAVLSAANSVHQMNNDVSTVFSNAPLSERILPSIRVGSFAVGTAATIMGGVQLVKAGIQAISVKTPYGRAWQSLNPEALKLRGQVTNGTELYRGGVLGKSNVAEGQFWAPESPLNPGFTSRYGTGSYSGSPDFVASGNIKPGVTFITRYAPRVGSNAGGALEVVTRANGVRITSFFMQ